MQKRKYPKLPNGYGTIKRLSGKNRTNPFAVYPPTKEFRANGTPVPVPALAYVDSWLKGFGVLTSYHNGTYVPGQELPEYLDCSRQSDLIKSIVSEYNAAKRAQISGTPKKTFSEIYRDFFCWKFERDKSKTYSENTVNCTKTAFKHLAGLHDKPFEDLRYVDLQQTLDSSIYRHASIEQMLSLLHQIYKYAMIYEIVDTDYSRYLKIHIPDDDEPGVPFSDDELKTLWAHQDDPVIELMLIICYSGYRILAYRSIQVFLKDRYFLGGIKTKASKDRIVPIHSGIYHLVERRMKRDGCMLAYNQGKYRLELYAALEKYGIQKHTPHDGRHTFSRLCEKYKVHENDRKRMMGHSFGSDITNGIYGHRTVEELREEIEKIKICH